VDLAYQWTAFLGCSVQQDDVVDTIKKWNASGKYMLYCNPGIISKERANVFDRHI
jgi:hypothetical protein